MRPFAGYERVDPLLCRNLQVGPCAAGNHADAATNFGSARNEARFRTRGLVYGCEQIRSRNSLPRHKPNFPAVTEEERLQLFQAERSAQSHVIAEPWMSIQRKMRAVYRHVRLEKRTQQGITVTGPWMRRPPKQSMVH